MFFEVSATSAVFLYSSVIYFFSKVHFSKVIDKPSACFCKFKASHVFLSCSTEAEALLFEKLDL